MSKAPPERAFEALTDKISRERGVSCGSYKDKCLKRRIAVRMRARGVHTYEDYGAILDRDAHEYQELLDALTINVTKFFRNVETWNALRPYLDALARSRPRLRVWSAGCASGEEPYTIAVLLAEAGAQGLIDATDVDRLSLERTRQAKYPDAAFTEMPVNLRRRYFRDGQPLEPVRALVRVRAHDLMRE
ncbi:MAG TPA: CheR family methyltransferase, partial [Gemmatimonadales bacterium]|nr:CheR family methyltransferase [Gemmatimonadales bacterium]